MKKMLQRIKSCLEITWRRWYTVSRAPWKLLEEDVAMYQERLGSYLKKMLRCIRAPWELLEEDVTMYQERLGSCLKKTLRCIKSVLEVTWRRCCNVAMLQRLWNADERTLLHSPQNTPFAKVTTVPTLEGRRHRKHLISSHDPTKSYDIIWHHMKSGVDGYNRFNMVGALALIAAEARRKAHLRPRAYGEELDVFIVTSK